jgi:hypothetical protein
VGIKRNYHLCCTCWGSDILFIAMVSQQPDFVDAVDPTSLRSSEHNSQPCQPQQSLEQGYGDFSSGFSGFAHDFGPQSAQAEGYSHTAHSSMHSSNIPYLFSESAAGTTEGIHGQPHQDEWDKVPQFLQSTLKAALLVSCVSDIDILILTIAGLLETLLSGDA